MVALVDLDPRLDDACMEAGEDLQPLPLCNDDHKTYIKTSLNPDDRKLVSTTLFDNTDLFSWTTADVPGVSPDIITHRLSVYKEAIPIAQQKRKLGEERRNAAWEETEKLLKVGFIRKARYTMWLANIVMVKKSNGKWGECV